MDGAFSKSKYNLGKVNEVTLSFENSLVDAHFRFASHLLDLFGNINEIFQEKCGFVNYFWEYIVPLLQILRNELMKIENGDFETSIFAGIRNQSDRAIYDNFETPHFESKHEVFQRQYVS